MAIYISNHRKFLWSLHWCILDTELKISLNFYDVKVLTILSSWKYFATGTQNHHTTAFYNKYSFRKKLDLCSATTYSWCLSREPLQISKADTKISIGGFQARVRVVGFISFLGWNTAKGHKIRGHSFICTLQCILLPCNTNSAVFHITAHDIYANSAHDLYGNSLWLLTTFMPTALTEYGQI